MNSIYVLSNSENIISDIKESLLPIENIRVEGNNSLEIGLDIINNIIPDILILGEDLNFDDIRKVSKAIKTNKRIHNIPLVFCMNKPDASKIDSLFKEKLADDCLILSSTIPEKRFKIEKLIELKRLKEELHKSNSELLYLQSEIATYERKRHYFDKKTKEKNNEIEANMMHKIRTYLMGIKGGVEILINKNLEEKDKENIKDIIRKNISNFEEFVNSEDLTRKEDNKSIQPTITQFKVIYDNVFKRAQFNARKNSVSMFLKPLEKDYSVLANIDDLEFGFESILNGLIYSAKIGSVIRIEAEPQITGNLLAISLKLKKSSFMKERFESYIQSHYEALNFLPQQNNKLEFFEDTDNLTIRFYLLRLS